VQCVLSTTSLYYRVTEKRKWLFFASLAEKKILRKEQDSYHVFRMWTTFQNATMRILTIS
jgi:hypothetical protein